MSTTAPRSPSGSTSFNRIAWAIAARSAVGHVREKAELAGSFDGARKLGLMAAAGPGDPGGADLAFVADRPPQRADVLVVDDVDLLATVGAGLAPSAGPPRLATPRSA